MYLNSLLGLLEFLVKSIGFVFNKIKETIHLNGYRLYMYMNGYRLYMYMKTFHSATYYYHIIYCIMSITRCFYQIRLTVCLAAVGTICRNQIRVIPWTANWLPRGCHQPQ